MRIKTLVKSKMSSELYGLALLAVVCIILSPFYKQTGIIKMPYTPLIKIRSLYTNDTIKSDY